MRRLGLVILLAGLVPASAFADPAADTDWREILQQDGVTVSIQSVAGRALPRLRGVTIIDANAYEIWAVQHDVPRQSEWMYNCSEARLISEDSDFDRVGYNRTAAGWPVSDRDSVFRVTVSLEDEGRVIMARFKAIPAPNVPEVEGVVRVPRLEGHNRMVALGPKRTRVEYVMDIDPGGSLPKWVIRRVMRRLPLHTLVGLRKQVARTRGQYESFVRRHRPSSNGDPSGK